MRSAFTSFHNCLCSSIYSRLKSSFMNIFVPISLFTFCKIFTLSLYLSRLHVIVRGLFPLLVLFCLLDVRCVPSISIGNSKPNFSWSACCNSSSQPSHVSPGVSRILSLLLGYFFLIYPLDLLASAKHIPDQSDSHISLHYGVRYLLVCFQHCSLFLPVGSL